MKTKHGKGERKEASRIAPRLFPLLSAFIMFAGCKSPIQIVIKNNYNFPVQVYDSTPHHAFRVLATIEPNATSTAMVTEVYDGYYKFIIKKKTGVAIKTVILPSDDLNAATKNDDWKLELSPSDALH